MSMNDDDPKNFIKPPAVAAAQHSWRELASICLAFDDRHHTCANTRPRSEGLRRRCSKLLTDALSPVPGPSSDAELVELRAKVAQFDAESAAHVAERAKLESQVADLKGIIRRRGVLRDATGREGGTLEELLAAPPSHT